MKLGCIGDDFTGSSDLANTLSREGMRTVQYVGIPTGDAPQQIEAGVVSLKSRSIPVPDAVSQSLRALDWLISQGCSQIFFKYCSTFDSTPEGNIGPVIDALADALDAQCIVVCPAFPGTGRSVYQGHLFVNDVLLNESGMQNHPLTPMTDPDLRRWLKPQTRYKVGHVATRDVFAGADAIADALAAQKQNGNRLIVVDAIRDEDLRAIGRAARNLPLITGGSGVALGLPANFGCLPGSVRWTGQPGKGVALSGSCSRATRAQVAFHARNNPTREILAEDVISGEVTPEVVADWLMTEDGLPLAYSSADPDTVAAVQTKYGRDAASHALETFFATLALICVNRGATRIITAGGETSGAVVSGLSLTSMEIGPEIDPGVPALRATPELVLALKSGNFGSEDFFDKANRILMGRA